MVPPSLVIRSCRARQAFTLIELLVVMVIIALLAALTMSVVGKAQEAANATKCTANLRQVGVGISSYCADHDGTLPGPLNQLQEATWATGESSRGSLARLLSKYLEIPETTMVGTRVKNVLVCPAWERAQKTGGNASYVMNFATEIGEPTPQVPWGAMDKSEPVKLVALSSWPKEKVEADGIDRHVLSQTWAVKDADQQAFLAPAPTPGAASTLPLKPVHGDFRTALFYDFHVGRLDLNDQPKGK